MIDLANLDTVPEVQSDQISKDDVKRIYNDKNLNVHRQSKACACKIKIWQYNDSERENAGKCYTWV